MLIVKIEDDQVVEHNNIVEEVGGGIPQFLVADGWIECQEPIIPQLAEYQELGNIQYIYNSQTSIATASYQVQESDYSEWGTYKDFVKAKLKSQYMKDILWTDSAKFFYEKFKLVNPSNNDLDNWFNAMLEYWNESRVERIANKQAIENASTNDDLVVISYNPQHVKSKDEIEAMASLVQV